MGRGILQPWERPGFGADGALLGDRSGNWKCIQLEGLKGRCEEGSPPYQLLPAHGKTSLLCVCAVYLFGTRDG